MKIFFKKNKGAVALVTLVLISVISLGFIISAANKSFDELSMGFRSGSDARVFNIAESCVEEVLLQIRRDTSYGVGAGTFDLDFTQGNCSVTVDSLSNDRTVTVAADFDDYYKKIEIDLTLTGNNITINNWSELAN